MDQNASAEELKIFENFYRQRLDEAGPPRDDAEELATARDILQAVVSDGLTPGADGGTSYVRRGAMDWSNPTTVEAAQAVTSPNGSRKLKSRKLRAAGKTEGGLKDMLTGVGMLIGVLIIGGWFVWPMLFGEVGEVEAEESPAPVESEPTVELVKFKFEAAQNAENAPKPVPTLEAELLADIVDAGGVSTGLVVPRTLEIKEVSFVVQPVRIVAGDWPLPDDSRAVSWVYGTVVNYTLGLEATPENEQLLASLAAGDEMLLRMSTGPALHFAFVDVVWVKPHASEVFQQNRPGLTLALLGAGKPNRIVVRAVYTPHPESDGISAKRAAVGETVLVDEALNLTNLGSGPLVLPAPPGYVHLGVDYVVENVLELPIAAASFALHVKAGGSNYPAIQTARTRTAGAYPALPAMLQPGQTITTTAVYAVPETALKEGLVWQFSPTAGGTATQVALPPYSGSLETEVAMQNINLGQDGQLEIQLRLRAPTLRSVEIQAADIHIQGGTLSPVGQIFPWRIEAGQESLVNLHLLPQDNKLLTVTILKQAFEIEWEQEGQ